MIEIWGSNYPEWLVGACLVVGWFVLIAIGGIIIATILNKVDDWNTKRKRNKQDTNRMVNQRLKQSQENAEYWKKEYQELSGQQVGLAFYKLKEKGLLVVTEDQFEKTRALADKNAQEGVQRVQSG